MSRLFIRIWLTFWTVLAATFLIALGIDYGLALQRSRNIERLSPQTLAASGADAFRAGEVNGRHWILDQHSRLPELQIMVVAPDGRELTGRSLTEVASALAAPPHSSPFPAALYEMVNGRTYRFVFRRTRSLAFDLWDVLLQPWVLGGLVLVISGAGSAFVARTITGPVRQLQTRVRVIAAGALESRMGASLTGRGDELGVLACDIDQMADRLQALILARDAMLRDVSHELRAPLARLRAVADLERQGGHETLLLARIDKEIDRLDTLIGQILHFSRLQSEPKVRRESVDLLALVEEVVADAGLEGATTGKQVALSAEGAVMIKADPEAVRSAVENVLRNAVRFSPEGGEITVKLSNKNGQACLQVLDRGPGVLPDQLAQIFEPFHGEGSGAGLGLAICRRIVHLHGGEIAAENRLGGGLEVRIGLPIGFS